MAKKAYIGVGDVARKIKKGYIGVGDVARKIKKAYIGIGGFARPCMSSELAYYGKITDLSVARYAVAATSVGDYAFFMGGAVTNYLDVYSKSLQRSTVLLEHLYTNLAATTVGDYAIFGGGYSYKQYSDGTINYSLPRELVAAINSSLSKTSAPSLSTAKSHLAATTVGNYAVFAGGRNESLYHASVDVYNASLTRSVPQSALSVARSDLVATSVGDKALFGGGMTNTAVGYSTSTVDVYNESLTKLENKYLNIGATYLSATTVGGYALFGGGATGGYTDSVTAFDSSLTRTSPPVLSAKRSNLIATTLENYAMFAGGRSSTTAYFDTVDVYDSSLTKTTATPLSAPRYDIGATTVGAFALFVGGTDTTGNQRSKTVEAYVV